MNVPWPRGVARLENGSIWVDPLPSGAPNRDVDGYAYYDPWQKPAAIYRALVAVRSDRGAQGFAQKWGPLGEPQSEVESEPRPGSPYAGYTGTELVVDPAGTLMHLGDPVHAVPPRGRLSRWEPRWHQPVDLYLKQAAALQQVSAAIVATRLGRPARARPLRDAIEGSGLVGAFLPRTIDMPVSLPPELDRVATAIDLANQFFRWSGTEIRAFLVADDQGTLSLAHEYRSLLGPALLGMLEPMGLGRLRPCHYPECPVLSARKHCGKDHERTCPSKGEHRRP